MLDPETFQNFISQIWGIWCSNDWTDSIIQMIQPKKQPKEDNFGVPPQGVDQFLHVDKLWGLDKTATPKSTSANPRT